jgi:hypothetical protein
VFYFYITQLGSIKHECYKGWPVGISIEWNTHFPTFCSAKKNDDRTAMLKP